ncbi:DDE-type integrase/transposase/recombinase [Yoonia sediminilitoris]|uniref:DDE-type integrase/transposase/recombinase n=1 Tax=Yoonia sediminilitoris TaxID=1286148 RepID=UPI001FE70173|nr:DDE-type integrase/transposase/recombinase [Yoonia sediminilitoris]
MDLSTIFRWVQRFGAEIAKRAEKHLRHASLAWHVDKTYIRVGGKWRNRWRAADAHGQLMDFRLTTRRDPKAAKVFISKAIERVRLHRPSGPRRIKPHLSKGHS